MPDEIVIQQILSTTPEVVPPVESVTYDTWALTKCEVRRSWSAEAQSAVYDVATNWAIGRILPDGKFQGGPKAASFIVRDILNPATIAEHPEIAQISPGFIAGLVAIGKRLGKL